MRRIAAALAVVMALFATGLWAWTRYPAESALVLGQWVLQAGDTRHAEALLQRFLEQRDRSPDSLMVVGQVFLKSRRWSEMARYLEEAVRVAPRHPGRGLLGLAYEHLGRESDAETAYREMLDDYPSEPSALNNLGYYYVRRAQRLEEASLLILRALALSPGDPNVLDSLGWAQYQRGQTELARRSLEKVVHHVPKSGEVRFHLGVVLARGGARDRALIELGKAVLLEPDLPGAREMLAHVRAGGRPPVPVPWRGYTPVQHTRAPRAPAAAASAVLPPRWPAISSSVIR